MGEVHKLNWFSLTFILVTFCLLYRHCAMFSCCLSHNRKFTKTLPRDIWSFDLLMSSDSISGCAVSIIKHWTGFGQFCVIKCWHLPTSCVLRIFRRLNKDTKVTRCCFCDNSGKTFKESHSQKIKKLLFSRLFFATNASGLPLLALPCDIVGDDCTSSRDWDPDKKNNRARRANNCNVGLTPQLAS